jgi:hypothetical protein
MDYFLIFFCCMNFFLKKIYDAFFFLFEENIFLNLFFLFNIIRVFYFFLYNIAIAFRQVKI